MCETHLACLAWLAMGSGDILNVTMLLDHVNNSEPSLIMCTDSIMPLVIQKRIKLKRKHVFQQDDIVLAN